MQIIQIRRSVWELEWRSLFKQLDTWVLDPTTVDNDGNLLTEKEKTIMIMESLKKKLEDW